jgi:hypothetical protein
MAIVRTRVPYSAFIDTATGEPLPLGFLFFGIQDQDPEQNPIQVQVLSGGVLVNTSQPIRTNAAGIPVVNGVPVELFIDGNYSTRVKNQFGVTIFDSPDSMDANADTMRTTNNLSDVANVATAVANLGLTGALLAANNLDDLASAAVARVNLGLQNALLSNNNLSDVGDAATARTNLGIPAIPDQPSVSGSGDNRTFLIPAQGVTIMLQTVSIPSATSGVNTVNFNTAYGSAPFFCDVSLHSTSNIPTTWSRYVDPADYTTTTHTFEIPPGLGTVTGRSISVGLAP